MKLYVSNLLFHQTKKKHGTNIEYDKHLNF